MALVRINEKPNAIPVSVSVFAIETQVSGVWYSQKVTWEQLVGLVAALDNLQNYYKKSETYTKQEVQALIAQIPSFTIEVVQQLPTEDISTTTLYLVPKSTPEAQDYYEEYINLDGTTSGWEYVGTTQVDLSNYYTKTETETYVKGDGADYIVGTKTFSALTTTVKSILGAINEVAGAASSAQADATQALADASTAQGTANSASAAASAAQTTADAAATAAGNAANAASAAQGTANQAVTAAGNAQSTADAAAAGLLLKEDKTAMPEDVTDIIKQMKTPKTVTGNPVTFETVEETYAKGAELTFGPIQDLHGYDSPWPAGAGKNKIDQSTITKLLRNGAETSNGITNSDGEITVTYTYGNQGSYSLSQVVPIHSGEITISADFMIVGSSGSAQIRTNVGNNTSSTSATPTPNKTITLSALNTWENKSVTYSLNENASDGITITLQASASGMSLKIKNLQVEIGSTATDYAPYENICPISGWDGLNLENDPYYPYSVMWNQLVKNGNFTDGTNNWSERQSSSMSVENGRLKVTAQVNGNDNQIYQDITIAANHVYFVSAKIQNGSGALGVRFGLYTGTSSVTDATKLITTTATETKYQFLLKATENGTNFRFGQVNAAIGDIMYIDDIYMTDITEVFNSNIADYVYSLEQATTGSGVAKCREYGIIKDFYNYNSGEETYMGLVNDEWHYSNSVTFPDTVSGGIYDFASGDGEEVWKDYLINDLTLTYSSSGQLFTSQEISGILAPASSREMIDGNMCEFLKNHEVTGLESGQFAITTDGRIRIKIDGYTTEEALKADFGTKKFCIKLATPEAITGTAHDILLNAGTNVVSTDADTAAVTYTEMTTLDDMRTLINAALNT